MDRRERAELFSRYVGLELKGRITTRGFTAKAVAEAARRSPAAFNRWLNGRVELPLTVLCEACEIVGVEPHTIIDAAYSRIVMEIGSPRRDAPAASDVRGPAEDEDVPLAARRGARKADVDHAD